MSLLCAISGEVPDEPVISTKIPILVKDGTQAKTDKQKANLLMNHYAGISNNIPLTNGYYNHYKHVIISNHFAHLNNNTVNFKGRHNNLFNLEQIINSIKKLKPNAAPGIDEIHNKQI